jgi:uracil-DNA glycosylase family 4
MEFRYREDQGNLVCCQCSELIITNPRCLTWGGTFDRKCQNFKELNHDIDFMLIGQNPWFNNKKTKENVYGRAFGAQSEKILIKFLNQLNFDISKIWITNATHCSVIDNDPKLVEEAFNNCQYRLLEEIKAVNPKVLVPLGNIAKKMTHQLLHEQSLEWKVYNIYHPNALSYNNLEEKYIEQLEELKRMIA